MIFANDPESVARRRGAGDAPSGGTRSDRCGVRGTIAAPSAKKQIGKRQACPQLTANLVNWKWECLRCREENDTTNMLCDFYVDHFSIGNSITDRGNATNPTAKSF